MLRAMWRSLPLIACLIAVTPAWGQAPRDKLDATLSSLAASKEDAATLRKKLARSEQAVKALRADATALAAELQIAERKVSDEEKRAATLSRRLQAKEEEFNARREEYGATLASLLHLQQIPPTAMIAEPENVHQVLRTARAMQHVTRALAERAEGLRGDLEELEALRISADASAKRLAKASDAMATKQAALNRQLTERQRLQAELSRNLAAAQARVAKLSRESQSLQELIGKLEDDRNRAAIASARPAAPPVASTSRGTWKLPVSGEVLHRFGERKTANETYRGLVLTSRAGGSVISPAAGDIVFTGPFRDYGRMVLVRHHGGKISLLAGLGDIAVTLNQRIGAGEPIGKMGAGRAPTLYYELRDGSKPIDPAGWFGKLGA